MCQHHQCTVLTQSCAALQVQQLRSEKADLSRQLAKAHAGNALLETHFHRVLADNADLSAQLANTQSGKSAAEKQLQQLQEDNAQVSSELASTVLSRTATEEQLERSTACNQQLGVQLADAARQVVQLKTDNQTISVELGVAEAARHGAEERLGVHQGQLLELQAQVTSAGKVAALHAGHCQHITAAPDKLQDHLSALLRIFKVAANILMIIWHGCQNGWCLIVYTHEESVLAQ